MAPKRIAPKEGRPAPSLVQEEDTAESEYDEDGPSNPSAAQQSQAQPKKAVTLEEDDSDSDDSDSDTDSDSDPPPTKAVKPTASKPMEATPIKPSRKRVTETETEANYSKKRQKKQSAVKPKDSANKQQLFERIWSEEDEIALLNRLLEFKERADMYDLVKKSLNKDDISMSQLHNKVNQMKKKFKKKDNGKDGEEKSFSNAHDQECFELSKKMWGMQPSIDVRKSNRKTKGNISSSSSPYGGNSNAEQSSSSWKWGVMAGEDIRHIVTNKGLDMVEVAKRGEFEKRWKGVHVATLKLFIQQNRLMIDIANSMLAAMDEDEEEMAVSSSI